MRDELLLFYKKYLRNRSLVFKKIPVRSWILPMLFLLTGSVFGVFADIINNGIIAILLLIVYGGFAIISVLSLNSSAKNAIKRQLIREKNFETESQGEIEETTDFWHWDGILLNKLKKTILINKFLKNRTSQRKSNLMNYTVFY